MEIIREAGVFVYGVLVFGVLSIGFAVRYARTRDSEQRFRWLVLIGLSLAIGLLGSVAGLQAAARYIASVPDKWLFVIGLREALHSLTFAICFGIVDLLVLLLVPRSGPAAREVRAIPPGGAPALVQRRR